MSNKFEPINIVQKTETNTGAVVFLHGYGDTADGILDWISSIYGDDFSLPNIKFIFPTAPVRPLTENQGQCKNAWFDFLDRTFESVDQEESIQETCKQIKELVEEVIASGIPANRIVIGGFSMGGTLALHAAYRYLPDLAGVFVLSSFMSANSAVYDVLKEKVSSIPLFMCQGDKDMRIPLPWARHTFDKLMELKVNGQFHVIPDLVHTLEENELRMLFNWISGIIDT